MSKIGIVTLYYDSINYGGVLQAYALARWLNEHGYSAKLINYDRSIISLREKNIFSLLFHFILDKKKTKIIIEDKMMLHERKKRFTEFKERFIVEDNFIYNARNIRTSLKKYDAYIVGSDQIWNGVSPKMNRVFLLDFVPKNKIKISYAASLTRLPLRKQQINFFKKQLKKMNAISVRENEAKEYLQKICNKNIVCTVDPTQLLKAEQWDLICANKMVHEPYLFIYLLGLEVETYNKIKNYAKKKGLVTVLIPFASGKVSQEHLEVDADYTFIDCGPCEFLSLIKYADCIVTDSFHATSFSVIYKKEFIVLGRKGNAQMSSRLTTLLQDVNLQHRFIDREYLTDAELYSFNKIEYGNFNKLNEKIIFSEGFLISSMKELKRAK